MTKAKQSDIIIALRNHVFPNTWGLRSRDSDSSNANYIIGSLVRAQQGEPKFGNPKLLPIGNGFGFLFVFEDFDIYSN